MKFDWVKICIDRLSLKNVKITDLSVNISWALSVLNAKQRPSSVQTAEKSSEQATISFFQKHENMVSLKVGAISSIVS